MPSDLEPNQSLSTASAFGRRQEAKGIACTFQNSQHAAPLLWGILGDEGFKRGCLDALIDLRVGMGDPIAEFLRRGMEPQQVGEDFTRTLDEKSVLAVAVRE